MLFQPPPSRLEVLEDLLLEALHAQARHRHAAGAAGAERDLPLDMRFHCPRSWSATTAG